MFGFTALVTTLIVTTVVGNGIGFAIVCLTEHHFPRNTSSKSRKVVSKTIYAALGWGAKAAKNNSRCMW